MMTYFQNIMDLIEQDSESENTTINEVNNQVKSWKLQYYQNDAASYSKCSPAFTKPTVNVCAADEKVKLAIIVDNPSDNFLLPPGNNKNV